MLYELFLGYDFYEKGFSDPDMDAAELMRPWIEELVAEPEGDPISSGTVQLTEQNIGRVLELLHEGESGQLLKPGRCRIHEKVSNDQIEKVEWFILHPSAELGEDDRKRHGLCTVNGHRVKPGPLVRRCPNMSFNSVYFADQVWDCARELGWSGLDACWVSDTGKYRGEHEWYHIWATGPLARGYDHPWFDPETIGLKVVTWHEAPQVTDAAWRYGINEFAFRQLRDSICTGSDGLDQLLTTVKRTINKKYHNHSKVIGLRRVPRGVLPDTDFAYLWLYPIERMPDYGFRFNTYQLCVTAEVRRTMLAEGWTTDKDFTPIIVLDEAPEGADELDRDGEVLPGPLFDGQWLDKLRAVEEKARAKYEANPKPDKPVDFKKVMTRFKRRAKKEGWPKGADADAIEKAAKGTRLKLPSRWGDLLGIADGFEIDEVGFGDGQALRVAGCDEITESHRAGVSMATLSWPDLPKKWLGVASTDGGDPIFLDTSSVSDTGDCEVIWFDHETGEDVARWKSIATFLDEALDKARLM